MPQFIYFDLGNVLLDFDHTQGARQVAELVGRPYDDVWGIAFTGPLEAQYNRGEVDCQAFFDEFCRRTETRPEFDALCHAVSDIFHPKQDVLAIVERLHQSGQRLGILSNTCPAHWRHCLARYSILNRCFGIFALSYELRSMKPEPAIYAQAADLAGVAPGEIFFTDDRPENIAGALAAGYDAVLFTSAQQLAIELEQRGLLA